MDTVLSELEQRYSESNEVEDRMLKGEEENPRTYCIHIVGVTPIKMNKFLGQNVNFKGLSDNEIAEMRAYRDENGYLCIPREWLVGMMINASYFLSTRNRRMTCKYVARRFMIVEKTISLQRKEFVIDKSFVSIENRGSKTCDIVVKPRIDPPWNAKFHIKTVLPKTYLKTLLEYGGREVGIGSDTKHGFGQFYVQSIEEVNEKVFK